MATKFEKKVFKQIRDIFGEVIGINKPHAYNDKHPGYRRFKFRWNRAWDQGSVATIAFKLGQAKIPVYDIRLKECTHNGYRETGTYLALVIKIPETLNCPHNKEITWITS